MDTPDEGDAQKVAKQDLSELQRMCNKYKNGKMEKTELLEHYHQYLIVAEARLRLGLGLGLGLGPSVSYRRRGMFTCEWTFNTSHCECRTVLRIGVIIIAIIIRLAFVRTISERSDGMKPSKRFTSVSPGAPGNSS